MEQSTDSSENVPPKIFGSWKNLYLIVLGNLVLMIIVFYLITLFI